MPVAPNSQTPLKPIFPILLYVTMAFWAAGCAENGHLDGLAWNETAVSLELTREGKTVWLLVADPRGPASKPYFHPLATGDGTVLTVLRPDDHPWHYGLWWSWKYINGLNYWEENPETRKSQGVTQLTGATIQTDDDFSATVNLTLNYHPPGGATLVTEKRQLSMSPPGADGSYWIDWTSTFRAVDEEVVLGRTPIPGEPGGKSWGGYAGLSARLVLEAGGWDIRSSEGASGVEATHGQQARWMDFSAEGKGIAILDHPDNPRAPTPWYVHDKKPMSFFSPSLLFQEPMTLHPGQPLTLRYRILVHSGSQSREQLETVFAAFARQPD